MSTFATPEPIFLVLDVGVGFTELTASDRDDTVVEVRPSDPANETDRRTAEQTRVERTADGVLVRAPKQRGFGVFGSKPGSIDVTVELPTDSRVQAEIGAGGVRCAGRIGECRVKTGVGDIQLEHTGVLTADAGAGSVTVRRIVGTAEVSTGSGSIRVHQIDGNAVLKNSNGDNWVDEVSGELRMTSANGSVVANHVGASVTAKSANGDVRVGDVTRGTASLKTALGAIEVGIHAGTAARLDVSTDFGRVHNNMESTDGPAATDETVDVQAHTSFGDIVIRRAVHS
ncbi:MAG TPA: DUF4097 family beta strand repeat-containing protein [Pseudonocardiaceae bacterium]|nr:DUF4097 family beta strand repeat-containing protein [Pseudonocardiaceae bacterium]